MKAKITAYLNERIQAPNLEADNKVYYEPGDTIEIVDIVNGQEYEGNKVWYKLDNGAYVWSGGVEGTKSMESNRIKFSGESLVNYNSIFSGIPDNYRKTKGEGVKVAVLDTGIFQEHPDFPGMFNQSYLFSKNFTESDYGYDDWNGHGSHVCGLISARSHDDIGIIGVAPNCEIANVKVIQDNRVVNPASLQKGIEYVLDSDAEVVNLSLNLRYSDYQKLEVLIDRLAKEKIVIAAAGRNEKLLANRSFLFYPAMNQNIISVGSFDRIFFKSFKNPEFNKNLSLIIPEQNLKSCSNEKNLYSFEFGSSMSTALVTGISALIMSSKNIENSAELLDELRKISIKYDQSFSKQLLLINPQN